MKKHLTSSIFIFHKFKNEWKIVLVHHKKFDRWMIPGGHVEENENMVEAVLREAFEETGLTPNLVSFIHKKVEGIESKWLLPPEFIFEQKIPFHKNVEEHYHLDCAYVGVVDEVNIKHRIEESNDIKWFSESELKEETSMFLSTQKLALLFFEKFKSDNLNDIITYKLK